MGELQKAKNDGCQTFAFGSPLRIEAPRHPTA
jgi:hypothetical protein